MLPLAYQYPMMIPPFDVADFSEMTKKQAQEHFNWFVNEIPTRIQILKGALEASGVNNIEQFNLTPQSLGPLWDWLKARIKTTPKSQDEMNELRSTLPDWAITQISDWKFESGSLTLALDVSLYFAEVLLKKNPNLYWGFTNKPRSSVYVNKPVVMGFKRGELHPLTVVVNLCSSYVEGNPNKDLLSLFEVWSKYI